MPDFPPLASASLPEDAIEMGRIAEPWGVKGWFKVHAHSSDPEVLFNCPDWFLQPAERGAKTFDHTRLLPVQQIRPHGDSIVASCAAVGDRDAAQLLRGARIFISRAQFPPPPEGEYYWVDLIGLQVINREGVPLGQVRELLATGPQTTLVLAYEEAGKPRERLLPFVAAFVDEVALTEKTIRVDWQPDY